MATILLALLLQVNAIGLEVRSPKQTVLAGEPIKLVLRWSGPPNADVILGDDNRGLADLQVWVDGGTSFRRYCETPHAPVDGVVVSLLPPAPRPFIQNISLVHGKYASPCSGSAEASLVFPEAGQYRLTLVYQPADAAVVATSNTILFKVQGPEGVEAELLAKIREIPWVLLNGGAQRELLARYPNSPYFAFARSRLFWDANNAFRNRRDPNSGGSLWQLSSGDYEQFMSDQYRIKGAELLNEASRGSFDEERLSEAYFAARRSGDADLLALVRVKIVSGFSDSELMQRVVEEEAKDEP